MGRKRQRRAEAVLTHTLTVFQDAFCATMQGCCVSTHTCTANLKDSSADAAHALTSRFSVICGHLVCAPLRAPTSSPVAESLRPACPASRRRQGRTPSWRFWRPCQR